MASVLSMLGMQQPQSRTTSSATISTEPPITETATPGIAKCNSPTNSSARNDTQPALTKDAHQELLLGPTAAKLQGL